MKTYGPSPPLLKKKKNLSYQILFNYRILEITIFRSGRSLAIISNTGMTDVLCSELIFLIRGRARTSNLQSHALFTATVLHERMKALIGSHHYCPLALLTFVVQKE